MYKYTVKMNAYAVEMHASVQHKLCIQYKIV